MIESIEHPEMFASRAVRNPQGRMMPMEDIPGQQVLAGTVQNSLLRELNSRFSRSRSTSAGKFRA
ncbi:hypothetical protein M3A49_15855 [Paraburkholderia sp. CNPSo 3076]|nr:hypothetical protein [Paraburkholderia sp. CNPSo 3076]